LLLDSVASRANRYEEQTFRGNPNERASACARRGDGAIIRTEKGPKLAAARERWSRPKNLRRLRLRRRNGVDQD
jgi:hypothetical protein